MKKFMILIAAMMVAMPVQAQDDVAVFRDIRVGETREAIASRYQLMRVLGSTYFKNDLRITDSCEAIVALNFEKKLLTNVVVSGPCANDAKIVMISQYGQPLSENASTASSSRSSAFGNRTDSVSVDTLVWRKDGVKISMEIRGASFTIRYVPDTIREGVL